MLLVLMVRMVPQERQGLQVILVQVAFRAHPASQDQLVPTVIQATQVLQERQGQTEQRVRVVQLVHQV